MKMKKTKAAMLIAVAAIAAGLSGCRREDVREVTLEIPGATVANKKKIEDALAHYAGVRKDSFNWDMQSKSLTLRYDSMKVAHTNLRMAIEDAGIEVTFPSNTTGRAGY